MALERDLTLGMLKNPRPGGAVLFLGAGFSRGAINSLDQEVQTAGEFANTLSTELGEPSGIPLTVISELYESAHGNDERALLRRIKNSFSVKRITDHQRAILSYPWKRIYTTNYDDVAEHVEAPDGSRPDSFERDTVPIQYSDGRRQIIHLNGYVGSISATSRTSDFGQLSA